MIDSTAVLSDVESTPAVAVAFDAENVGGGGGGGANMLPRRLFDLTLSLESRGLLFGAAAEDDDEDEDVDEAETDEEEAAVEVDEDVGDEGESVGEGVATTRVPTRHFSNMLVTFTHG